MTPSGYFPPPYLLLWSLYFLYKVRRELGHGWETDYVVFMYPSLLTQSISTPYESLLYVHKANSSVQTHLIYTNCYKTWCSDPSQNISARA